jgi:hypothetical protein
VRHDFFSRKVRVTRCRGARHETGLSRTDGRPDRNATERKRNFTTIRFVHFLHGQHDYIYGERGTRTRWLLESHFLNDLLK